MKKALITGITGQDGAWLAKHLLSLDYEVYGSYRRAASVNFWRIQELDIMEHPDFHLVDCDLTDTVNTFRMVADIEPDEIYNLAAQSFVEVSFRQPLSTAQITGLGAVNLLEAIRLINPEIKYYQASTSEMFGLVQQVPQTEETPFYPRSPYGIAKLYAHWMTINYRESYHMYASCGILFNHESTLRGKEFVTRKISDQVAQIALGQRETIELGNMDAKRDWGHAEEYVKGMHLMLQAEKGDTYILATQRTETVRKFVRLAFESADIDIEFEGESLDEVGIDRKTGKVLVSVNPQFYRPAEVDLLVGDAAKAKKSLGWEAQIPLESICDDMVKADIYRNENGFTF